MYGGAHALACSCAHCKSMRTQQENELAKIVHELQLLVLGRALWELIEPLCGEA